MTGLSFLSERKYKENIVKLWDKIYSYTYKTLPSLTFIGMMADEVNPDAVFEQDGKKYIDYARVRLWTRLFQFMVVETLPPVLQCRSCLRFSAGLAHLGLAG
jgi:hypothetical protein